MNAVSNLVGNATVAAPTLDCSGAGWNCGTGGGRAACAILRDDGKGKKGDGNNRGRLLFFSELRLSRLLTLHPFI
jgi:hypothetical protein